MEAIGEKIGRTPEFQDTSFETIFRDVAQGKFEAVISAATITEEREKEVAFSNPYYLSEQAILVKEGSDINGLDEPRRQDRRAPSRARPASNSARKKPTPANSAPTPKARTRSTRSRPARSKR